MPVIKSAKKKLRQDRKREIVNQLLRKKFKTAVANALKTKNAEKTRSAAQLVDKAVKKGLIHKNKAARIKSRLSKAVKPAARKTKPTPKIKSAKRKK